ncbi:hypothetical protein JRQ81_001765 [Phrynocephalus forsythii]|uniref:Tc1-like transposase DDE domain-containing protein n=1 Tax=Phrynocephalus forsythii TaxID=171643 RepID=A0A9Q0Y7T1_9SAUR|nr:hypothetical protein JRQ81_001765 [Phrynocephalus forsythii]
MKKNIQGRLHFAKTHLRSPKSMWGKVLWSDEVNVEGIMNSSKCQSILAQNLQASARKLNLRRNFMFQHDNDTKHTSKSTKEWLHQKKINVLEWPSQSRDLNLIEYLWGDLKRAVHRRRPCNLTDLEHYCKEE